MKKQKEFCCDGYLGTNSLKGLLDAVKEAGYVEEDYINIEFELDYGGCYYESDSPSIIAKYRYS